MYGGITERYESLADSEAQDDLPELGICGDGMNQLMRTNTMDDFINHAGGDGGAPDIDSFSALQRKTHEILYSGSRLMDTSASLSELSRGEKNDTQIGTSDPQTVDQNETTLSSLWGSPLSSPLMAECGVGSREDIWKSALTSSAAECDQARIDNNDDIPTEHQQNVIEKRMSSFWAEINERELTSKDEFLAAWTKNVEDIQQDLVASQIQQIAEVMEDEDCQSKTAASSRGADGQKVEGTSAAQHDDARQYPKWILFDQSPTQCPEDETDTCQNPFIEELDSDYPSPNSPTQCLIEELDSDDDHQALRSHRTAGLIDVRRPNTCPTHLAKTCAGEGDQLNHVKIAELFFHKMDEQHLSEASVHFSKTPLNGRGDSIGKEGSPERSINFKRRSQNSTEEDTLKQSHEQVRMRKPTEVDDQEANGETGSSEEDDLGALLVMDVEELPKEAHNTRLRRILGLAAVCNRIQRFMSTRAPPCCSNPFTNPAQR